MFLSCGFPSIVAGGRRRIVFSDLGGLTNSEDFEGYEDGLIDSEILNSINSHSFEGYSEGVVGFGRIYGGYQEWSFELSNDGLLSGVSPSANVGHDNAIPIDGYATPWPITHEVFEGVADGITNSFSYQT